MYGHMYFFSQLTAMWNFIFYVAHIFIETNSWIKIDQLDVTRFIISPFTAQHVSNVSTSIFRSLRLTVNLFHVLYFSGSMCVGVTTPPQPNHNVTPTHIEPEQYKPWDKSTISRKLLKMGVLTFETCRAVNGEIIKRVTSSWSIFIPLSRWCTVQ
jgi:hypothetical protein